MLARYHRRYANRINNCPGRPIRPARCMLAFLLVIVLILPTACLRSGDTTSPAQTPPLSSQAVPSPNMNEETISEETISEETTSPTETNLRTKPEINGLTDLAVPVGIQPHLLVDVTASDQMDGGISCRITYETDLDIFQPGHYTVYYQVENSAGLTTRESRLVEVYDRLSDHGPDTVIFASQDPGIFHLLYQSLDFLADRVNQIGLYYYDLESDLYFTINPQRSFRSASTAKLFLVMALYDQAAKGLLDLDQEIYFTENDWELGSGIIRYMNKDHGFRLQTLAELAMIYSDNIAYRMIMRTVGRRTVYDYYESVVGYPVIRSQTEMSAEKAMRLLYELYHGDNPHFPQLLDIMRRNRHQQALPRYLPEQISSNKIGFYMEAFHDIGIIHAADGAYILAVFSETAMDEAELDPDTDLHAVWADILAELSQLLYSNR